MSTYCCFVDCTAAFDCVYRTLLLYALQNAGLGGHFLKIMKAMYTDTQCVVKVNNKVTGFLPMQVSGRARMIPLQFLLSLLIL